MDKIHKNKELVKSFFSESYKDLYLKSVPWVTGAVGIELQKKIIDGTFYPGMNVFEIGCGVGTEAVFLSRQGMDVKALDIEKKAINIAFKYASLFKTNIKLINQDFLELSIKEVNCTNTFSNKFKKKEVLNMNNKLDLVIDQGCFHHILPKDRKKYVQQLNSLLKSKGMFMLRGFSHQMKSSKSGDGPIRLTKKDILDTFSPFFDTIECYIFDNLPVPDKKEIPQKFWLYIGRLKK